MYSTMAKCTRWWDVRAGGRNGGPSANRDENDNSLLRYVPRLAAANHPRPCRCRVVCSRSFDVSSLPDFHHTHALSPIPVRAQRSRRQVQIVPPPLRQAHPRSGTRQGQAPGAHYPNASAARHRLLFAASRTQERRRGVKQAGNRWRQNFGAGRSDRWLAAVSETIHVG